MGNVSAKGVTYVIEMLREQANHKRFDAHIDPKDPLAKEYIEKAEALEQSANELEIQAIKQGILSKKLLVSV